MFFTSTYLTQQLGAVAETTGGVSPVGWIAESSDGNTASGYPKELIVLIDEALNDYDVIWAAAGHPHAVFPTTFLELQTMAGAQSMKVSE